MDNSERKLFLELRSDLGQPDGADSFRLHWEFWLQLKMMADAQGIGTTGHIITAVEGSALAEFIEQEANEAGWLIHLEMWGDGGGMAVAALCRFLKSGGFEVVEFRK